jgi:hypothetical protein
VAACLVSHAVRKSQFCANCRCGQDTRGLEDLVQTVEDFDTFCANLGLIGLTHILKHCLSEAGPQATTSWEAVTLLAVAEESGEVSEL